MTRPDVKKAQSRLLTETEIRNRARQEQGRPEVKSVRYVTKNELKEKQPVHHIPVDPYGFRVAVRDNETMIRQVAAYIRKRGDILFARLYPKQKGYANAYGIGLDMVYHQTKADSPMPILFDGDPAADKYNQRIVEQAGRDYKIWKKAFELGRRDGFLLKKMHLSFRQTGRFYPVKGSAVLESGREITAVEDDRIPCEFTAFYGNKIIILSNDNSGSKEAVDLIEHALLSSKLSSKKITTAALAFLKKTVSKKEYILYRGMSPSFNKKDLAFAEYYSMKVGDPVPSTFLIASSYSNGFIHASHSQKVAKRYASGGKYGMVFKIVVSEQFVVFDGSEFNNVFRVSDYENKEDFVHRKKYLASEKEVLLSRDTRIISSILLYKQGETFNLLASSKEYGYWLTQSGSILTVASERHAREADRWLRKNMPATHKRLPENTNDSEEDNYEAFDYVEKTLGWIRVANHGSQCQISFTRDAVRLPAFNALKTLANSGDYDSFRVEMRGERISDFVNKTFRDPNAAISFVYKHRKKTLTAILEAAEQEVFTAAIENVLYHATSVHRAAGILTDKKFRLTTAIGTDSDNEHQNGRIFFLSTSRSRHNRYTQGLLVGAQTGTVLNIDKNILQQNLSIKPVDYWGWNPQQKELEDRVFSNSPELNFAKKPIIQEVHAFLDKDFYAKDIHASTYEAFIDLIRACKKQNVRLFLYDSSKNAILQNKGKALPLRDFIKHLRGYKREEKHFSGRGRPSSRVYDVGPWLELLNRPVDSQRGLSERADKLRYNLKYSYYEDEQLRQIKNTIHNAKTRDREAVNSLVNAMRSNRIKTIKELVPFLKEKWDKKVTASVGRKGERGKSLAEQGKPDFIVIYRSVPQTQMYFMPDDYVTLSKKFAIEHAEHGAAVDDAPHHVIKAVVASKDVFDAFNPGEYFYGGEKKKGRIFYTANPQITAATTTKGILARITAMQKCRLSLTA